MPNTLAKNLHFCMSLIKPHHHHLHPNNHPSQPSTAAAAATATATAATRFFKNYNSVYEDDEDHPASPSSATSGEEEAATAATLDLTALYASRRFFISSPGTSNSIVDSLSTPTATSSSSEDDDVAVVAAGGVAVHTYSPDPYVDFRKSMQEMVESRDLSAGSLQDHRTKLDEWDYLQDLLLSYLSLNPKSTHKYIVGAFADLVASLMSPLKNSTTTTTTTTTTTIPRHVSCSSSTSSSSSSSSSPSSSSANNKHHHSLLSGGMLMHHDKS